MINLTVFRLKDVLKLLGKVFLIVGILWILYIFLGDKETTQAVFYSIAQIDMRGLLEENIPGIEQIQEAETEDVIEQVEEDIEALDPLKIVLDSELKMASAVVKKEEQAENVEMAQQPSDEQVENEAVEQAQTGLSTQVLPNNVPTRFTNSYRGVEVRNETSYQLTEEMLTPDTTVSRENIMIFHTHTCESYTPSEAYPYTQTGTYRTTDLNFSVARVGTELERQLKSYQYNVIHDVTYHDYPAYNGSYGRSLTTVKNLLQLYPNTDVVIDLHRDAIGDYSYAPTVQIGEEYAAQLMFVIGTDGGGLEHPNWQQNLKFAIKIQEKANELYPGLFKPIILRNSRYNQHLAKAATIIEVGATGNTLDQCLVSMKYLAKVISEVVQ